MRQLKLTIQRMFHLRHMAVGDHCWCGQIHCVPVIGR